MDQQRAARRKERRDLRLHAPRNGAKRRVGMRRRNDRHVRIFRDPRIFCEGEIVAVLERAIGQIAGAEQCRRAGIVRLLVASGELVDDP